MRSTLSWRRPLSYTNQSIDLLLRKSMDWFLYDNALRHERVKQFSVNIKGTIPTPMTSFWCLFQWRHSDVFIINSKTHLHILEFWNFKNFLFLVASSVVATRLLIFAYIRKM